MLSRALRMEKRLEHERHKTTYCPSGRRWDNNLIFKGTSIPTHLTKSGRCTQVKPVWAPHFILDLFLESPIVHDVERSFLERNANPVCMYISNVSTAGIVRSWEIRLIALSYLLFELERKGSESVPYFFGFGLWFMSATRQRLLQ